MSLKNKFDIYFFKSSIEYYIGSRVSVDAKQIELTSFKW